MSTSAAHSITAASAVASISTLPRPGSILDLRDTPVVPTATIPTVGKAGQDDPDGRLRLLRLGASLQAEGILALGEAAGSATLAADLGKYAPDPALAAAVLQRLQDCRASNAKAQALAAFTDDQEAVARNDAMSVLIALGKEMAHAAEHDAAVIDRYPRLASFDTQRKQSAVAGKARAKKTRAAVAAAAKTAPATTTEVAGGEGEGKKS